MKPCPCSKPPFRLAGFSLVEPLAAMVIAGAGLLALVKFQANLVETGSASRQRVEALRLAQEKLEDLRYLPYSSIVAGNDTPTLENNANVSYARTWTIPTTSTAPDYKIAQVTVSWTDQKNIAQSFVLSSLISNYSPALSGYAINEAFAGTGTGGASAGLRTPFNRGITIPIPAVDQLDGTSIYAPPGTSGVSLRFNNTTGEIVGITDGGTTTALSGSDVGRLITGYITEASTNTSLHDINLAMSTTSGYAWNSSTHAWVGGTANCWDDRNVISTSASKNKTTETITLANHGLANGTAIQFANLPGGSALDMVTTYYVVNATTNTFQVALTSGGSAINLAKDGTNIHVYTAGAYAGYVTYSCVVKTGWSGSVALTGFTAGTTSSTSKVCRYYATGSGDLNGNSTTDSAEHPYLYPAVTANLSNQNYRVLTGNTSCPTDPLAVLHQP